jgi:TP901-1 family phage major tail protein
MAAQKGRDLLIKIDDGTGAFVTVAGLRTRHLSLNAATVDITSADSTGQWRELLAGAGVKRASLSGTGVFKDAASDAAVRQTVFDGTIRSFQITIPDFGVIQGPFQVAALDYRAEYAGEVTFDIALESAGSLTFTAL